MQSSSKSSNAVLVLTNLPDEATAQMLARHLVERRLAACVNILPAVRSIYRWQNTIEESVEITLLIKTTQSRYFEMENAIKMMHPYDVPEIIAVPIMAGLPAYLDWMMQQTTKDSDV